MPTAYTAAQLAEFDRIQRTEAPPFPVSTDIDAAAPITAITTASAPEGLLLNAAVNHTRMKLYLNPVVARQLALNIIHAGNQSGWWDAKLNLTPKEG